MTTSYLPPVNLGGPPWTMEREVVEAIMEGPEFVRTSRGGRWHKIRAGKRWISETDVSSLRESYELFCGMHASDFQGLMLRDVIPDDEALCGKCYGAALGADPARPEYIFLPRNLRRPTMCPTGQTRAYREDPQRWNRGWCLACGEYVKLRAYGGIYNGGWGAQRHEPGPDLVDPCPFHGWKELVYDDTGARCRCGEKGIKL